jgi:hypothetical protein
MQKMSDSLDLLAGYATKGEFATALRCHERTIDSYRKLPDGLPSVVVAGRVYIPIDRGREWIAARILTPNPTQRRKAG